MTLDCRGVSRGGCLCGCRGYRRREAGSQKCMRCGHVPTMHTPTQGRSQARLRVRSSSSTPNPLSSSSAAPVGGYVPSAPYMGGGDDGSNHEGDAWGSDSGYSEDGEDGDGGGVIEFYDANAPYYEFTNFYRGKKIVLDGKKWPTSEHYFQAQKYVNNKRIMRQVRHLPTARDAFRFTRQYPHSRADWHRAKDDVMYKVLTAKFTQDESLYNLLMGTAPHKLVEASPFDAYWGYGADKKGQNKLGKLLVRLRDSLATQPKPKFRHKAIPHHHPTRSSHHPSASSVGAPSSSSHSSSPPTILCEVPGCGAPAFFDVARGTFSRACSKTHMRALPPICRVHGCSAIATRAFENAACSPHHYATLLHHFRRAGSAPSSAQIILYSRSSYSSAPPPSSSYHHQQQRKP